MSVITIRKLSSWQEFIEENNSSNEEFICRGHTNEVRNGEFIEWEIVSSFNRYYSDLNFRFESILGQQLEESLFESYYGNYKCVKDYKINNVNTLTKLYFLQHYGVPTCLIDFTYNPFIALYFAISNIKGQQAGKYSFDGIPNFYPDNYHISVYKINVKLLVEKFEVNEIKHIDNSLFLNYFEYRKFYLGNMGIYIALDKNPEKKLSNNVQNHNLIKQQSCFILFDNGDASGVSLETFINKYSDDNQISLTKPLIEVFKIPYNSILRKQRSKHPSSKSLFKYLHINGISGQSLFNDFQGLKYDLNFFHQF